MPLECSLAIIKKSDKILYSLRSKNPYYGHYEFPGGKIDNNESAEEALSRECFEELGIKPLNVSKIGSLVYSYIDIDIKLHIFEVKQYEGTIYPKENQKLSYLNALISSEKFLASTYRIINYISLPRYLFITPKNKADLSDKKSADNSIINMIRFRANSISSNDYIRQAKIYSTLCFKNNTKLILDAKYYEFYRDLEYCGIHYTSQELRNLNSNFFLKSNKTMMHSASCHNLEEIYLANKLNLDFIIVSPVLNSKYNTPPIGWDNFKKLSLEANMPVFALGGISKSDLNTCLMNDGYGVSGISNF